MTAAFIAARGVHIGACLLLFGVFAFDRFVLSAVSAGVRAEDRERRWLCRCSLILLPIILLSGIAWLAVVAVTMSGQSLRLETVRTVWLQTDFGDAWRVRLLLWLGSAIAAAVFGFSKRQTTFREFLVWVQLLLAAALLGSLAFAGHGLEDSRWHLSADVVHLLVAGLWPTGLLPFLLSYRIVRQGEGPADWESTAALVRRFSALSLGSVALLTLTGLVNAWYLVGSFANLVEQPYGRWLMLKLALFVVAIAFGAVNLLRLKPRLTRATLQANDRQAASRQLQVNVRMELLLGTAVIVVVAILGILPPAIHT
jgi:putative copper resistance protein D